MSDSLDPLLLNSLPAPIRTVVEAQTRALVAEQAARLQLQAENADLRASTAELKALNARLEHLSNELRRARFGPSSEKLSSDLLELAFEERAIVAPLVRAQWRVKSLSWKPSKATKTRWRRAPAKNPASGHRAAHGPCQKTCRAKSG